MFFNCIQETVYQLNSKQHFTRFADGIQILQVHSRKVYNFMGIAVFHLSVIMLLFLKNWFQILVISAAVCIKKSTRKCNVIENIIT